MKKITILVLVLILAINIGVYAQEESEKEVVNDPKVQDITIDEPEEVDVCDETELSVPDVDNDSQADVETQVNEEETKVDVKRELYKEEKGNEPGPSECLDVMTKNVKKKSEKPKIKKDSKFKTKTILAADPAGTLSKKEVSQVKTKNISTTNYTSKKPSKGLPRTGESNNIIYTLFGIFILIVGLMTIKIKKKSKSMNV
jgi:LPXTG-motif cell wall-anchored protein